MKITKWIILALLCLPAITTAAESKLDDWYIGFGIGTTNAYYEHNGQKHTFKDWFAGANDYQERSLNFKVGVSTQVPNLLVGLDITDSIANGSIPGVSARLSIINIFAMATYFPYGEGLFLRGGAGVSRYRQETNTVFSTTDGGVRGTGFLVGVGYYVKLTRTFGLSANLDIVRNQFDANTAGINKGGATLLYLGFDWY